VFAASRFNCERRRTLFVFILTEYREVVSMAAMLLKAKEAAETVYADVRRRVEELGRQGIRPHLAVLIVRGDPASAYYARAKMKTAEKLGVAFRLHEFEPDVQEQELIAKIAALNDDAGVHGIMLELPLPGTVSAAAVIGAIAPCKDIDGVTPANKLAVLTGEDGLYPATPQACIRLLQHYGYTLTGKNVTLVGRGQTVGMPLMLMLQRENATVTLCHSRTPDIAAHLRRAEIAFVAVGRPDTVTGAMAHPGLVIVDAGINETAGGAIVGDVAPDVADAAAALSPVPGGVGTLTTAILFENLLKAAESQLPLHTRRIGDDSE
jgi:methylenetetrahydrofolate dehydrogenase (NADP+)/methenyltetrahydrofolate cyclohydrolase